MARIFRDNGFEVYGIACKAGAQKKTSVGIPEECNAVGVNMCNPILQAKMLNEAGTELNVVVGCALDMIVCFTNIRMRCVRQR